jgi:hypothetical protein
MIWKLHIGIPARLGSVRLAHSRRNKVTAEDPMMVGAATVFVVTDIAKSTEHYRDVLVSAKGHARKPWRLSRLLKLE